MSLLDSFFDNSPEGKMAKKLGITKADVKQVFADFDEDGSGKIDSTELQKFAGELGLYWDAATTEMAFKAMDTDADGAVDLKEFATWFCGINDFAGQSDQSEFLKTSIQVKCGVRQVAKALKKMRTTRPGRECKNTFGVQVGEVDKEASSGMIKFSIVPSSAEAFATFSPPEGAHCCVHADFLLKDDCRDEDIEKIKAGAEQAFEMFIEPMLAMMPPPPAIPGLAEPKPYHSHVIQRVENKLRFVVFSGIDIGSLYRETGLDAAIYVPQVHAALFGGSPLSFLNPESGCTLADVFAGRLEMEFTWNTRMLHALKAIVDTTLGNVLVNRGLGMASAWLGSPGSKAWLPRASLGVYSAVFRMQKTSVVWDFNGFHEFFDCLICDTLFPMLDSWKGLDNPFGYPMKFENLPTAEDVAELVKAVGAISGKTFQYIRGEALACGQLMPNPFYEGDWEKMQPCDPLYPVKHAISNMIPPPMQPFKEAGLAFLSAVRGYSGHAFHGEIVQAGLDFRGLNWGHLLPTEAQIMAAECGEPVNKEEFMTTAIGNDLMHPLGKYCYKEVVTKMFEKGWVPAEALPPPFKDILDGYTYSDEDMAKVRDGLSEIFDILRISIKSLERIDVAQYNSITELLQGERLEPQPYPVMDALAFTAETLRALVQ